MCHIPYTRDTAPFRVALAACQICRKKLVPELLLATIEVCTIRRMPFDNHSLSSNLIEYCHVSNSKLNAVGISNPLLVSHLIIFSVPLPRALCPSAHCPLPTAHCPLPTAHRPPQPPAHMPVAGAGIFIEARVCRAKRRAATGGEAQASLISESGTCRQ